MRVPASVVLRQPPAGAPAATSSLWLWPLSDTSVPGRIKSSGSTRPSWEPTWDPRRAWRQHTPTPGTPKVGSLVQGRSAVLRGRLAINRESRLRLREREPARGARALETPLHVLRRSWQCFLSSSLLFLSSRPWCTVPSCHVILVVCSMKERG